MAEQQPNQAPPDTEKISRVSRAKAAASKSFLEGHYASLLQKGPEKRVTARPKTISMADFEPVALIGRGSFGEVRLCRVKGSETWEQVAIKKMRKDTMHRRNQTFHIRAERSALTAAGAAMLNEEPSHVRFTDWVVELRHCFQDEEYLYVVMEYLPGGDLMTWLTTQKVFPPEAAKFYIAELCLAVHSVHLLEYVHRDIKPDNVLMDATGHIKLTDFGLCKHFGEKVFNDEGDTVVVEDGTVRPAVTTRREMFYSTVGSPGYVAPEVLLKKGYGIEVDWWSVGVILYEMVYGYPPFHCDDPVQTCHRIVRWREFLRFPQRDIPYEYISLMQGLLCDASDRLTFEGVRAHPLFANFDWDNIRKTQAYYQPTLRDVEDISYFPHYSSLDGTCDERSQRGSGQLKQIDPRGVLFADFAYNNVKGSELKGSFQTPDRKLSNC